MVTPLFCCVMSLSPARLTVAAISYLEAQIEWPAQPEMEPTAASVDEQ